MESKNNKFGAIRSITALLLAFVIIFNSTLPTVFAGEVIESIITAVEDPIESEPLPEESNGEALPEEVEAPPEELIKPQLPKDLNDITVTFITGGSLIADVLITKGETLAKPADPARVGYQFKHWSTANDSEVVYNFNTPVNETLTLYAVWTPAATTYSVVYWLEKADMGADDVGTDTSKYEFKKRLDNQNGISGQVINFTAAELNKYDYFAYSHTVSPPLLGNGTSVVNVYFKRIVYTFIFDLVPRDPINGSGHINYFINNANNRVGATYTFNGKTYGQGVAPDGTTYNEVKYELRAKLDMNVEALWPYPGGNIIKTLRRTSNGGITWDTPTANGTAYSSRWYEIVATGETHYQNSQMDAIVASVLTYAPKDKPGTITYKVNYDALQGTLSARIWLEALPHETPEKIAYGKNYILSSLLTRHSFTTTSSSYGPLPGFTPQHPYTSTTTGLVTDTTSAVPEGTSNNRISRDYYLYRNRYTLSFNTGVGASTVASKTVMYEEKLVSHKPEDPTRDKYTFAGWYTTTNYLETSKIDFSTATMPIGDLKLFAKWDSSDNIVTFYNDLKTTRNVQTDSFRQGVASGANIIQPANYIIGHTVSGFENKGTFNGWVKYINDLPQLYSFESEVYADLELYARWKANTYTVTFIDHKGNTIGTPEEVISGGAATLQTPPDRSGYYFKYWGKDNGTGTFVDATTDLANVTTNLTVTAVYDTWFKFTQNKNVITITGYKSNIPSNVVIPAKFDDFDVLHIGYRAFYDCNSLVSVNISSGVTSIGDMAFGGCHSLKSITIPSSVVAIGYAAFYYCDALTSIVIPNGVKTIGYQTFRGCYSLTSIDIPSSITAIGYAAFYDCRSLTSITIPNDVTVIEDYTFEHCHSLTSVTIPKSVTAIGRYSFYNCYSLTDVNIPDSVTTIKEWAFAYCDKLPSAIIPNSVTAIEDNVFFACKSLSAVTIPESVTTIGAGAFNWCFSLTSITIPDSVINIGNYAFGNCTKLEDVSVSKDIKNMSTNVFTGDIALKTINIRNDKINVPTAVTDNEPWGAPTTTAIKYLNDISGTFTVTFVNHKGNTIGTPTAVVSGSAATVPTPPDRSGYYFNYWGKDDGTGTFIDATTDLANVTADLTVTTVYDTWFTFSEDEGEITITGYKSGAPNDVVIPAKFDDIDVLHIGEWAFYENTSLISVIMPDSITAIGRGAFSNCESLTSVTISNGVTEIKDYAFLDCVSLTAVTIPDSVTSIGEYAFGSCTKLEEVSISKNIENMPENVFDDTTALLTIDIRNYQHLVPTAVTDNEPWGAPVTTAVKYLSDISGTFTVTFFDHKGEILKTQEVESGNAATAPTGDEIPERSGYYFKKWDRPFTSVTANLTITAEYDTWFEFTQTDGVITITGYKPDAPNDVVIPAKFDDVDVLHIGEEAFDNSYYSSTSITSVIIPNSIITIGDWAFYYCYSLTTVTVPDSVTAIGMGAFYDCDSLASINISNGVTEILEYTFSNCNALTSVTIPDSVTSIAEYAFDSCTNLKEVSVSKNIVSMAANVFSYSVALEIIEIRNYQHLVPTAVTNNEPWGAPATTVIEYLSDISGPFTVTFVDHKGNTIGTPETVVSGGAATAPAGAEIPERSGYYFKGWDKTFIRVRANLTITAVYDTLFYFSENKGSITITGYVYDAPSDVVRSCS